MKYQVCMNYSGTILVPIEAESLEEAVEIAGDLDPADYIDELEISELYGEAGDVLDA